MNTGNLLNLESSRMEAFRLLSIGYRLPDRALVGKIKRLEMHMANISEQSARSVQRLREEFENNPEIELLKIDFSKLFLGPYNLLAPPYASVYLDGERKIMGDSTLDVIDRYREAGLETAEGFKDAPDHISAELEFMYFLIFKELEALSGSKFQNAIGFVERQKHFLVDHLMVWVPRFASGIKKYDGNQFFPYLAEATELLLKESHRVVCSVLDSWQHAPLRPVNVNLLRV